MKQNLTLPLRVAFIPIVILVLLLSLNVTIYGDDALSGSNQFVLLIGGAVAAVIGFVKGVSYQEMIHHIAENLKSVTGAILILLFVGALAGTWLISGIIPAMIYYGLQLLNPTFFLVACIVICALISIATGSSWTTSATVGIALIGIGKAMGMPVGMIAGAVISGAYFGDKMSPLSDTTNLAPAMAGGELFSHIRYMALTTVPTIVITLLVFLVIGLTQDTATITQTEPMLAAIKARFHISPLLFAVPVLVVILITKKTPPLVALFVGTLLGALFALIFQQPLLALLSGSDQLSWSSGYRVIMDAITVSSSIETTDPLLNDLFQSGGM